jgi:hypothetical protein
MCEDFIGDGAAQDDVIMKLNEIWEKEYAQNRAEEDLDISFRLRFFNMSSTFRAWLDEIKRALEDPGVRKEFETINIHDALVVEFSKKTGEMLGTL